MYNVHCLVMRFFFRIASCFHRSNRYRIVCNKGRARGGRGRGEGRDDLRIIVIIVD